MTKQLRSKTVITAGELEERRGENGQVRPPSIAQLPQGRRRFQRRQSDGAPEGVEEKFEYGSREAGQAAQTLQSLGAMVYPPANKDTFDWGILAGAAQPLSVCLSVLLTMPQDGCHTQCWFQRGSLVFPEHFCAGCSNGVCVTQCGTWQAHMG